MPEDQTLGFQRIVIDCATKESATKEDFDEFFAQKTPSAKSSKCFRACVSETLGTVSIAFNIQISVQIGKQNEYSFILFLIDKRQ